MGVIMEDHQKNLGAKRWTRSILEVVKVVTQKSFSIQATKEKVTKRFNDKSIRINFLDLIQYLEQNGRYTERKIGGHKSRHFGRGNLGRHIGIAGNMLREGKKIREDQILQLNYFTYYVCHTKERCSLILVTYKPHTY